MCHQITKDKLYHCDRQKIGMFLIFGLQQTTLRLLLVLVQKMRFTLHLILQQNLIISKGITKIYRC
jgi:hypothetical protein